MFCYHVTLQAGICGPPLKKRQSVINGFDSLKVHTIYKGTIIWTINDDSGNPHRVEITNSIYVPKVREWLIIT